MTPKSRPVPSRTIAFLAAASFASAASVRACDPILAEIGASFAVTPGVAARVVTVFGATYACAQLAYGFVGDRFGKLETVCIATLLSALTAAFCAFATTLNELTVARVAAGGTAAAIIPLSMAWIGDEVDYHHRQAVIARFLTGQILGLVLGQVISGIVAEYFGWKFVFWVLTSFFLVCGLALGRELLKRKERHIPEKITLRVGLGRWTRMLRKPWVAVVLATVFFEGAALFGGYAFVGSYLKERFNSPYDLIGSVVSAFGLGGLMFAIAAPAFVTKFGERGLAAMGGAILVTAFAALSVVPGTLVAAPATLAIGLGFYMLHNTLQTNATQMAPALRGLAVSSFATCFFMGQSVGVALGAPIYDRTGGVPLFLGAGIALLSLGLIFSLTLKYRPKE